MGQICIFVACNKKFPQYALGMGRVNFFGIFSILLHYVLGRKKQGSFLLNNVIFIVIICNKVDIVLSKLHNKLKVTTNNSRCFIIFAECGIL